MVFGASSRGKAVRSSTAMELLRETRAAFASREGGPKTITMAYYPDGRQEAVLAAGGAADAAMRGAAA